MTEPQRTPQNSFQTDQIVINRGTKNYTLKIPKPPNIATKTSSTRRIEQPNSGKKAITKEKPHSQTTAAGQTMLKHCSYIFFVLFIYR